MARQKNVLRGVHKDIVIITQPIVCYSPLMYLLPRNWLRWLFPYRAVDMQLILHDIFTKTKARAVGFASPLHTEVYFKYGSADTHAPAHSRTRLAAIAAMNVALTTVRS
jgi:hypothetical protein